MLIHQQRELQLNKRYMERSMDAIQGVLISNDIFMTLSNTLGLFYKNI